jgi:hypothetical protein
MLSYFGNLKSFLASSQHFPARPIFFIAECRKPLLWQVFTSVREAIGNFSGYRDFSTSKEKHRRSVAAVLATTSAGVAEPAALVENVVGHSALKVMTYLDTGRTIRLGPRDTIVLSYLHSCVRETIIGGTVTIGVDQSEVRAGKVTRTKLDCGESMFVPTGNSDAQFAGRVSRGTKPHTP